MAQTTLFTEDFENAASVAERWKDGTYTLEKSDRGTVMRVMTQAGDNKLTYTLDAEKYKGRKIVITAQVKAENVSAKPKSYNGIKVLLYWQTADKKDWPQATIGTESFDWQRVQFIVNVPHETMKASLMLGLESVTGTVWFDDLSVRVEGKAPEKSFMITPKREDLSGSIVIEADKARGSVNPFIFGHNLEAADGKDIFSTKPSPKSDADGIWNIAERKPTPEIVQFSKDIGMKMMRYPGGCLVHNFDWKKAVGPYDERPNFAFGIDELVEYCRAVGAEPLMTVAVYVGTPEDKAELVEYCNAPATPEHPWAMKRAQWGHKEPYGIKYFEIGNEEDHGNHNVKPFQKFTAEKYADYFLRCVRSMKAIDPSIKMSVHAGTGTPPSDPWNAKVFSIVKDKADLIAIHTYLPPVDMFMRSPDIGAERLTEYREVIRKNAGKDIPMAITEYNGGNHELRFSYGAALFCADYVRYMLEPKNNIFMAEYWHFIGGFWGFVRKSASGWTTLPAYYTFRLWGEHFGSELLGLTVESPRYSPAIANAIDDPDIVLTDQTAETCAFRVTGKDSITMQIKNAKSDDYPLFASAALSPASTYVLTFKARTVGSSGDFILGVGIMDSRGWGATKSAKAIEGIESAGEWNAFSIEYNTLPDASGVVLTGRIRGKSDTGVSANVEIKDLRIARKREQPYRLLTASASRSADGKTLCLMVFNKSMVSDITTRISVKGAGISRGKMWQVNAESLDNKDPKKETTKEIVSGAPVEGIAGGAFTVVLPAHSMTAFNFR